MGEELRILWLLAIGLGLACFFGYICQKLKQSPIIGYLLAGYLLGPNSFGPVADTYISEQLANIGVTLLMFAVGLSFNWKDLIAVRKIALPGALLLSAFSISAGTLYSVYLGETVISGFVVGVAICVSSTVVIVRILSDQGLLHTRQGHIVVGWTIVEDLISVFGLLLLPTMARAFTDVQSPLDILYQFAWVLAKIAILALFVQLIGEKLIEKTLKIIARTRSHELFTLAILSSTFFIAIGSSYLFGVSLALGAFIAGTIVGKTDMTHQAAANALPMRDAFAVIFFLSVGMLFSPLSVLNNLPLFFGILAILLLIRPLLAFQIVKKAKYPFTIAFTVALAIAQIGEYSFILAEEGSKLNILPDNAYDILVACAFISICLNPILFQIFRPYLIKHGRAPSKSTLSPQEQSLEHLNEPKSSFLPRAVVIGFGPVGQKASKHLLNRGYHVTIIDQNIDTISSLKSKEVETIFGDAAQFHILEKAEIQNTKLLVVTVPELSTSRSIIHTARNINPFIPIIARVHFQADLSNYNWNDISIVCDEEASSDKLPALIDQQI